MDFWDIEVTKQSLKFASFRLFRFSTWLRKIMSKTGLLLWKVGLYVSNHWYKGLWLGAVSKEIPSAKAYINAQDSTSSAGVKVAPHYVLGLGPLFTCLDKLLFKCATLSVLFVSPWGVFTRIIYNCKCIIFISSGLHNAHQNCCVYRVIFSVSLLSRDYL